MLDCVTYLLLYLCPFFIHPHRLLSHRLAPHYLPGVSELNLPPPMTAPPPTESAVATGGVGIQEDRSPRSDEGRSGGLSSSMSSLVSSSIQANEAIDQDGVMNFLFQPLSQGTKMMCIISRQSKFKVSQVSA